jgi:hypothetical protein
MPETRQERLLLAIVVILFGIQVTLVGGGPVGIVLGLIALLIASIRTSSPRQQ